MPHPTIKQAQSHWDDLIKAFTQNQKTLNDDFVTLALKLSEVKGKILCMGVGKNRFVAGKFASTLSSLGSPALFLHPAEGNHGDLGLVQAQDFVVLFSKSGETDEILSILPRLRELGVPIASIVADANSSIGKFSDICIAMNIEKELGNSIAPTISTTLALALADTLALLISEIKSYTAEDFAKNHPGGIIGKRLLLKVQDVMWSGANLPTVYPDDGVDAVLMEFAHKRMGAVCVVSTVHKNNLAGFITEGDLRRGMQKWGAEIFSKKAQDLMSTQPLFVYNTQFVGEAIDVMENKARKVYVLPVLDKSDQKLQGLVRMHDLLR